MTAQGSSVLLTALLLLADQTVKVWAAGTLPGLDVQPFVPGVLDLTYVQNPGMAWGLLGGAALPLATLRLLVGLGLLVWLTRTDERGLRRASFVLLAAGALGNALDGLRLGYVVDMFASPALSSVTGALGAGAFPVFNVADVWVVSGVLLLLADGTWRRPRPDATRVDA